MILNHGFEINETVIFNDYAVQTRYPGNYTPIDEEEYKNAIKMAENCVNWIEKKHNELSGKINTEEKDQPYLDDTETRK
jgi:hypothetical protein